MDINVVIIAGGRGTRFWPVSRESRPKQLLNLFEDKPLIESTIQRVLPLISTDNIYISTGADLQPKMMEIIGETVQYIIEPVPKDTAAAIGLSAVRLMKDNNDEDAIMIVLPADHYIKNQDGFLDTIKTGIEFAKQDMLVTIGIKPDFPSTGYGYIRPENTLKEEGIKAWKVGEFFEKPDAKTAEEFIKKGYFWNSGMFIWKCSVILNEMKKNLPGHYQGLMKIRDAINTENEFNVIEEVFNEFEKISIDFGVMEKSQNSAVIEGAFDWDDVGTWRSYDRHLPKDEQGNVVQGKFFSIDSKNNIVISEDRVVSTIGISNMIIVDTKDALLIVPKDKAEDVKKLVDKLEQEKECKHLI